MLPTAVLLSNTFITIIYFFIYGSFNHTVSILVWMALNERPTIQCYIVQDTDSVNNKFENM
jgi:hypothetical protein